MLDHKLVYIWWTQFSQDCSFSSSFQHICWYQYLFVYRYLSDCKATRSRYRFLEAINYHGSSYTVHLGNHWIFVRRCLYILFHAMWSIWMCFLLINILIVSFSKETLIVLGLHQEYLIKRLSSYLVLDLFCIHDIVLMYRSILLSILHWC